MNVDCENIRFIASASTASKSHTERVLALSLIQAADHIDRLKAQNREASALVGQLSFELTAMNKENQKLVSALRELTLPKRCVK